MIGRLRGVVADIETEETLIDVMGVGYVVRCGARTLQRLPPLGEEAVLHIDSQTREDGTRLYGFLSKDDRSAFLALQAIQGVGPKAALAVLDVLPPAELTQAIAREDKAAVARASGVGPKLALRIVTELKGKSLGAGLSMPAHSGLGPVAAPTPEHPSASGEAVAALIGLGIAEPLGRRAVETAIGRLGVDATLPTLIKAALQELGR
ncbi:Holliday junction branch migration protein RuvA [Caulobacter sp. S45]|uniref:Holliday junction branch migration protein RuvA n=1 Tax=Caulobacter sp. S45 TaxID=1641861 RepID=UPI00131DC986|nr:Holliday junction branch migration protein RuvA [Caulobacter sp. S45]